MNKKILIGVIVVVIVAILGVLYMVGSSDLTLVAGDDVVTLPSEYMLDDKGIAYKDDVGVLFAPVMSGNASAEKELFDALKSNGKDAGYKKIKTDEINGFKVYEFSAAPDKLKTVSSDRVSSGDYEYWHDYAPYKPYEGMTNMDVAKYRYVGYVKDNKISELIIFTNNTNVDLYSDEINGIVNSISIAEK